MLDWGASAGGCRYVFRAIAMPWIALCCAIALLCLIGLRIAFVRWRKTDPFLGAPRPPPMVYGAGMTLLAVTLALTFAGCNSVKPDESFRADVIFRPVLVTCGVAAMAGLAMGIIGVLQLIFYRRMPLGALLPWSLGALGASLATMGLALAQAVDVGDAYLPVIDLAAAVGFHAGVARHVRPQLFRRIEAGGRIPLDDPGWTVDDVVFEAPSPGVVERTASARQGPFTVSTRVKAKAHADAGSPWFPLRVGNEWHYTLTTTSKDDGTRYLLFFTGSTTPNVKTAEVIVTIEKAPARDGWREYTLVVKSGTGDALGQHLLRPIDDETYFYDPPTHSGVEPADEPEPTNPKSALHVLLEIDPGTAPERGCRMADMGAGRCQMGGATEDVLPPPPPVVVPPKKPPARAPSKAAPPLVPARVPTAYALGGPNHLSTQWESHGGAASWIVGVLTMGIVIPVGMSGGQEYVLMQTVRGAGP